MTTYRSRVTLTPLQARLLHGAVRDYVSTGASLRKDFVQTLEAHQSGPLQLDVEPSQILYPVERAIEQMGFDNDVVAIHRAAEACAEVSARNEVPTDAQALAELWLATWNAMRMTSTSTFCFPRAGG